MKVETKAEQSVGSMVVLMAALKVVNLAAYLA
jgi:hypothetical protein